MIIEISIATIAVAFVFLVIYLIVVALAARKTLQQAAITLDLVNKQLGELGLGSQKVIDDARELSCNLKRKMENLDSAFHSISHLGEILEYKTFLLKKDFFNKEGLSSDLKKEILESEIHAEHVSHKRLKSHIVSDILELLGLGIRLWQNLNKGEKL